MSTDEVERALKLIAVQECRDPPIEIDVGSQVFAMAFSANGEYILSGGEGVRVWRVEDGTQVARMEAMWVRCLAVSKDGRRIVAGARWGEVFVWDAKTYEQVFKSEKNCYEINKVDFSPDSSRLVTASDNRTASIWDMPTRKRVQTLYHDNWVRAAKFSPQGDRIATATPDSIRVWDSKDGRLLVDIKVGVTPLFDTGLLWSNDHLFVISDGKIKQINASTGSVVLQWPLPESDHYSCIALPKHGEFVAYTTERTVTFWGASSHIQLGHIQHPQDIRSTVLSPDDEFIAIGGERGNIIVRRFSRIIVSVFVSLDYGVCERLSRPNHSIPLTPGTIHSDKRRCT